MQNNLYFHFYNEINNLNPSPNQIEIYVHSNEASSHNTPIEFNLWHKKWATLPYIYPSSCVTLTTL
jgi:hypothetical protein